MIKSLDLNTQLPSRIPTNAELKFKGKIFTVYQWEQEMFEGPAQTFEMLKRQDTTQVIVIRGDKVLINLQEQPTKGKFYSLFGGRVEEGESPLLGAKRELLEESGMSSEDWSLWKIDNPLSKIDWKIYTFVARDCVKTQEPCLDGGERIEVLEVTFEEFLDFFLQKKIDDPDLWVFALQMQQDSSLKEDFRRFLFDEYN
jgi:ADP-ribose pyrophosphatase